MKKIFTLFAAAALTMSAYAQYNNPVTEDGEVIVKYDLNKGQFAESNDFELDENVCIAFDITGNDELQDWLAGATRSNRGIAFAMWTDEENASAGANLDGRLYNIKGNIWGMIFNFFDFGYSRFLDVWFGPNADYTEYSCLEEGHVTTFWCQCFGYGYVDGNSGAEWWNFPQEGVYFTTLPYTGTRTSKTFYKEDMDEYAPDFFAGEFGDWAGYCAPTAEAWAALEADNSAISTIAASNATERTVEYYNIQGQKLTHEPTTGFYIRKATLTDGTVKATKIAR